jgi:hypothetical protein
MSAFKIVGVILEPIAEQPEGCFSFCCGCLIVAPIVILVCMGILAGVLQFISQVLLR